MYRNVFFVETSLDSIIKSIARVYRWTVADIERLFFDEIDYHGIIYWFNDAKEYIKQTNNAINGID